MKKSSGRKLRRRVTAPGRIRRVRREQARVQAAADLKLNERRKAWLSGVLRGTK